MKLDKLALTNFRCFKHEQIDFDRYTAIVGANNCGKSTIFKAIDLFFRTTQKTSPLRTSDFTDPSKELLIVLTFSDLPSLAAEEFKHYYRHGKLEFFIKARIDSGGEIISSIHGKRSGISEFGKFFGTNGAQAQKAAYTEIRNSGYSDLPELSSKSAVSLFEAALREYEAAHPNKQVMVESEDLAFGASGVASRLKKYVDWVYIPAVKDASDEDEEAKDNAFGILITRIIRSRVKVDEKIAAIRSLAHNEIKSLVGDYKEEVKKLETALDGEFRELTSTDAHVHLDWTEIDEKSVTLNLPLVKSKFSDGSFRGEISQFGHGLQRNYLITLVHLNAKLALEDAPSLVLACEEPELYQHPPQARYLHTALQKVSSRDQVMITTHSPYFISARTFENVRVVRKTLIDLSKIFSWSVAQHRQLIAESFNEDAIGEAASLASLETFIQPEFSEAFFCGKLVLVEGAEDRALLVTALEQHGVFTDFVRAGGHIVPVNSKPGLINMIAIVKGFKTPHFVIFDADTDCKKDDVKSNKTTNTRVLALIGLSDEKYIWPTKNIFDGTFIIWKENIQAAILEDYKDWLTDVQKICATYGWKYDRLKKNPAVLSRTLSDILGDGKKIANLTRMTERLMEFVNA